MRQSEKGFMRCLVRVFVFALAALVQVAAVAAQQMAVELPANPLLATEAAPDQESVSFQHDLQVVQAELAATQAAAQKTDDLQRRVELLQKQIEIQQKTLNLMMEHIRKQPIAGTPVDKLQLQVATLDARSNQAALRDQELAAGIDNLTEHIDAQERYGPSLPSPLKELFLPSGTNETPLSIYGALAFGYSRIIGDSTTAANGVGRPSTPGGFYFGEFTPDFILKLNDWIFLEAEISASSSPPLGSFAQADFFINDWLTIIAGRFVAPIGWFNERLNNPWINKLPGDAPGSGPLLWQQVLPPMSLLGVQAQGSFYLGCSPFKLEYSAYISNGLNFTPATAGMPTISELANLENMTDTTAIIANDKMIGGRLGLWWPSKGLEAGLSGLYNGDYVAGGFEDSISLWALDFNYRKGNWDVRFEYGMMNQQVGSFAGTTPGLLNNDIHRHGYYGQIAYRPWDAANKYLQRTEVVYRYSNVSFSGFDPTMLDLTTFSTPVDVPVHRQQNEFGINHYFYPRCVLKVAYQVNDEPGFHLHDNQFITELAWGW
jgi:hypothetical protein